MWAPGSVWTGAENVATTGTRSPDRPARSGSLYQLSCPGPHNKSLHLLITCLLSKRKKCFEIVGGSTCDTQRVAAQVFAHFSPFIEQQHSHWPLMFLPLGENMRYFQTFLCWNAWRCYALNVEFVFLISLFTS